MYIDAVTDYGDIHVWVRDECNTLHHLVETPQHYLYESDPDGTELSLFGDKVRKKFFDSGRELRNYRDTARRRVWESDIPSLYKYLSNTFYGVVGGKVNVGYYDIEVDYDLDDGNGFPSPENPFGKINAVSLFDDDKKTYHMVILHEEQNITLSDEEFPVVVHHCVSERHVLDTFFKLLKDIDLITAWNGTVFDLPYIIHRCMLIYGEREGLKKLCRQGFSANANETEDSYGNPITTYTLKGRVHIDMMDVYKKFSFNEKPSYSLDNITRAELGETKLKYKGDLGDLYRSDPQTFFEYSLHDSRLLYRLDQKLRHMELVKAMAHKATIRFHEVLGSIKYLEGAIRNYAHHDRKQPIIMPDKRENDKESFEGGYVIKTNSGRYGWSQSIDLASLYPSVIRAINISPETHQLQCMGGRDDFIKVVEGQNIPIAVRDIKNDTLCDITAKDLYDMIKDKNWTISANGSVFNYERGLIPEILEIWYSERKKLKQMSKEFATQGDHTKSQYYDMMQNLMKLNLNSTYGAVSNTYCRFYDIDLAKSVTLTGQEIEKFQAFRADELLTQCG